MKRRIAKQLPSILFFIFFSPKSMNTWFSLYLITENSIKIFFHEIKLGKKSRTNYHCSNAYFITYLNEEHVIWTEAVLQFNCSYIIVFGYLIIFLMVPYMDWRLETSRTNQKDILIILL